MLKDKRIISIILLIIFFCILAIFVNSKNNLLIDEKIYSMISKLHSNVVTAFFKSITYLGNAKFIGCFCILLLILNKTRSKVGIPITVVVIITGILNILLKNIFGRQRPSLEQLVYEDSFSFPSGHSMIISVIYSMIIYLSCKYIKNKRVKYVINGVSMLLIFLVGISRVYLRVHYFSDVLSGWCLGIVITLLYSIISEKIVKRKELKGV